jgi:CRISPR-associated protein Cst1
VGAVSLAGVSSTTGTPLRLTTHPLQRCGARAAAVLAGRSAPAGVTVADLDAVAERLTGDIARASVAPKDSGAYDWWKVLFALYPNSPATHSKRSRDLALIRPRVAAQFVDGPLDAAARPCVFCGQAARVVWGKARLPMFDSAKAVNTLPPRSLGWPVCRGCRIAMWALPYGAWLTAGWATVLSCASDEVEGDFVARNVIRARRILQLGFANVPADACAELVALNALRQHVDRSPLSSTLWTFQNDNEVPKLRVTITRGGVPSFLRRMDADPDSRRGWSAFAAMLTVRDSKSGQVKTSGTVRAARTLFDPADQLGVSGQDRLPRQLLSLAGDLSRVRTRTLLAWRALCRLYLEVMCGMDVGQVKPVRELITDWITQEKNPRGRFNEYARVSGSAFKLQKLLMLASARLLLDGREPPDITSVAPALLDPGQDGWRLRGLLFFDVVAGLAGRDIQIGQRAEEAEEAEEEDGDEASDDAIGSADDDPED